MYTEFKTISERHPCFSREAHHKYNRIHLPVAKRCNLGCKYCERKIGSYSYHDMRPGLTKKIMTPQEALGKIYEIRNDNKLRVIGIAGPGEPLFNQESFQTFELIHKHFPGYILCISTNGILISKYIKKMKDINIRSVSITINACEIEILKDIYSFVINEQGKYLDGYEAAKYIKKKQWEALNNLVEYQFTFKVNTVLIPGINTHHVEILAQKLKKIGVKLHNIVPLIPLGEFNKIKAPSCDDLKHARNICEKYIPQFRYCKQCSSDIYAIT